MESDPRDLIRNLNPKYQKIQDMFSRIEKTFTEKSEPVYLNELGPSKSNLYKAQEANCCL